MDAPFSSRDIDVLNRYQNNQYVHPLTCSGCSPSRPLKVSSENLYCPKCGHTQTWAPESCVHLADASVPKPLSQYIKRRQRTRAFCILAIALALVALAVALTKL